MCARARVRGGEFGLGCNEPIPIHCCFRCHRRAPNLFSHFMTEKTQPFTCVLWNIYSNIPNVLIGKPHHNPRNWVSVQWPKSLFCDSITRNTHQCRRRRHHRIFRKCKLENLHLINSTSEHSNNTRTHTHHSNIRIASLSILPFSTCVCVFLFFSHILLAHLPFSFARHFFPFLVSILLFFRCWFSFPAWMCVCSILDFGYFISLLCSHTSFSLWHFYLHNQNEMGEKKTQRERRATTMEKQRIKYPFANSFNFSKCTNTHTHS